MNGGRRNRDTGSATAASTPKADIAARSGGRAGAMSWTWNVRSNDGAMNGLEFARCTAAGGWTGSSSTLLPARQPSRSSTVTAGRGPGQPGPFRRVPPHDPDRTRRLYAAAQRSMADRAALRAVGAASRRRSRHLASLAARRGSQLVEMVTRVLEPYRPPGGLGTARPARPPRILTGHPLERSREPSQQPAAVNVQAGRLTAGLDIGIRPSRTGRGS